MNPPLYSSLLFLSPCLNLPGLFIVLFPRLACIFTLMSYTELGPFGVLGGFFFFFFFSLCFLEGFLTFLLLVFDGFESFPLWFDFMPFWLEYRTDFFAGAFSSASLHLHQQVLLVFCGTLLPLPDTLRGFTSSSSSSSYSASSKCCPLISTSPELLLDHR